MNTSWEGILGPLYAYHFHSPSMTARALKVPPFLDWANTRGRWRQRLLESPIGLYC
jgi:hypothetical protein